MADSSIFTQEEKKKILNELRTLEERKQVILSSQHQKNKELFSNETEEKKRVVKDIIEFKQVQKKYRIQLKNSYKETWNDDIELNNIQKEIDDLISNNKELLLDIYKENDSSGDLKPYLNEFDRLFFL